MACVVDTGSPTRDIHETVRAAAKATVNAPASVWTCPNAPRPSVAPAPPKTAPSTTNRLQIDAAVANRTIRLPTAVPNTLAASLAPSDQPRKRPLVRKNSTPPNSGTPFPDIAHQQPTGVA